jgi:nitroreductase
MMDVFEAVEQRRSIKHYDANAEIPEDDFNKIMSAVLRSPTSFNIQNWRFVRVKDKDLRAKMKEAAWNQAQVSDAAELIILCGYLNFWDDRPERYWANADEKTRTALVDMIKKFYSDKEQDQRDEAMRSCGIAAQTLMLTAKALGYDTCPMVGFDPDAVAKLINLPSGYVVTMMIVMGKSTKPAHPRGGQLPLSEILIDNKFS